MHILGANATLRRSSSNALRRNIEGSSIMKILVTGSAGFVGFHVAKALLQRGDAVVGFDVVNSYYDPTLKEARLRILEQTAKERNGRLQVHTGEPGRHG